MSKKKNGTKERMIVINQKTLRPYGVRTLVHLKTAASFGNTRGVSHFIENGQLLNIIPNEKAPWEGGDKFLITLEGFPTATVAEKSGHKMIQALLWTSISMNFDLKLEYNTHEPTRIFDRTLSAGNGISGYATVGWPIDRVLEEFHDSYIQFSEPDPAILLSMEIFSGARLELSQRSQFLAIVSALEPLAKKRELEPELIKFIDSCIDRLNEDNLISEGKKESIRNRLALLKTESIRQSILGLIRETLPKSEKALKIIDEAYKVRSAIVHKGQPDELDLDLSKFGNIVRNIIRDLYSNMLNRKLFSKNP